VSRISEHVGRVWDDQVLPTLTDYIRIPALSPAFDPDWKAHGHLDEAVRLLSGWAAARLGPGASLEVIELAGRSPVIWLEFASSDGASGPEADTVLLYGHLDKQPEMAGWREGLGPWTPVRDGDRLYGRGGADDGYALFAAIAALEAVVAAGGRHARAVVLIEASEESGSPDLPAYIEALAGRIGTPSLVVALDSGCGDYERLWLTTSLRGLAAGVLSVATTTHGVHSGSYGGVLPSTFRIARRLLDRVEDSATGEVLVAAANVAIPEDRLRQAERTAEVLGGYAEELPVLAGVDVVGGRSVAELLVDKAWRPSLEVIGADGLPPSATAGNVLRARTALALSLRLPPTADPVDAREALGRALTADPPYGALVEFEAHEAAPGWAAPSLGSWLSSAVDESSRHRFGNDSAFIGEGGTIPFMGMLGERFPEAQFLITGVLGPESNAHGPNEFLHVPMAKKLTECVADLLIAHAGR